MSGLALDPKSYGNWKDPFKIPNPIARAHWHRSCENGGSRLHKVIWCVEIIPIIGNIVALFERSVVCSARAFVRRWAPPSPQNPTPPTGPKVDYDVDNKYPDSDLESSDLESSDPDSPSSTPLSPPRASLALNSPPDENDGQPQPSVPPLSQPAYPQAHQAGPVLPLLSTRVFVLREADGPISEPPAIQASAPEPAQTPQPQASALPLSEPAPQASALSPSEPAPKLPQSDPAKELRKKNLRIKLRRVLLKVVRVNRIIRPAPSAVVPSTVVPSTVVPSTGPIQCVAVLFKCGMDVAYAMVNMKNSNTVRVIDERLTRIAPSFNQLFPNVFEGIVDRFIVLQDPVHPFRLAQVFLRGTPHALEGEIQFTTQRMMAAHCQRPANPSQALVPQGYSDLSHVLEEMVNGASRVLDNADQAYNGKWKIIRECEKLKRDARNYLINALARPGLSEEAASRRAEGCVDAMCKTMNQTLLNLSKSNQEGAGTAQVLNNCFFQCLVEASKPFLSAGLKQVFQFANLQMAKKFTGMFIVDAAGQMLQEEFQNQIVGGMQNEMLKSCNAYKSELFKACPLLAEYAPLLEGAVSMMKELTNLEKMLYEMHVLQYLKHMFVLQDAMMRTGTLNFNVILASKDGRGDPEVAKAVTAVCSILSGGYDAFMPSRNYDGLTQTIETSLRSVLAMSALTMEMQNLATSGSQELLQALTQDGFVSPTTCRTVSQLVGSSFARANQEMIEWWQAPSSPEMLALKHKVGCFQQIVMKSHAEASLVQKKADQPIFEGALAKALGDSFTQNSYVNYLQAAGVQLTRVPLHYMLFGDLCGMLPALARATAVQGAVFLGKQGVKLGVKAGVRAANVDDKIATWVTQLCAIGDKVAGRMAELEGNGQRALEAPKPAPWRT